MIISGLSNEFLFYGPLLLLRSSTGLIQLKYFEGSSAYSKYVTFPSTVKLSTHLSLTSLSVVSVFELQVNNVIVAIVHFVHTTATGQTGRVLRFEYLNKFLCVVCGHEFIFVFLSHLAAYRKPQDKNGNEKPIEKQHKRIKGASWLPYLPALHVFICSKEGIQQLSPSIYTFYFSASIGSIFIVLILVLSTHVFSFWPCLWLAISDIMTVISNRWISRCLLADLQ